MNELMTEEEIAEARALLDADGVDPIEWAERAPRLVAEIERLRAQVRSALAWAEDIDIGDLGAGLAASLRKRISGGSPAWPRNLLANLAAVVALNAARSSGILFSDGYISWRPGRGEPLETFDPTSTPDVE